MKLRRQTEHQLQCAIVQYCDLMHWPVFHVPNGGARDRITGAILKRQGTRAGIPDLFLPIAARNMHGFFLELKAPGKHPSAAQQEWIMLLNNNGYLVQVHNNLGQAMDALDWYMGGI